MFVVHFPVEHGCSPLGLGRYAMGDKGDGEWGTGGVETIALSAWTRPNRYPVRFCKRTIILPRALSLCYLYESFA